MDAEKRVRSMGAHKALIRGFYDRYTPGSVMKAANGSQSSIDKKVAEIMNAES